MGNKDTFCQTAAKFLVEMFMPTHWLTADASNQQNRTYSMTLGTRYSPDSVSGAIL